MGGDTRVGRDVGRRIEIATQYLVVQVRGVLEAVDYRRRLVHYGRPFAAMWDPTYGTRKCVCIRKRHPRHPQYGLVQVELSGGLQMPGRHSRGQLAQDDHGRTSSIPVHSPPRLSLSVLCGLSRRPPRSSCCTHPAPIRPIRIPRANYIDITIGSVNEILSVCVGYANSGMV